HTEAERPMASNATGQQPAKGIGFDDFQRTSKGAIRTFDVADEMPFAVATAHSSPTQGERPCADQACTVLLQMPAQPFRINDNTVDLRACLARSSFLDCGQKGISLAAPFPVAGRVLADGRPYTDLEVEALASGN